MKSLTGNMALAAAALMALTIVRGAGRGAAEIRHHRHRRRHRRLLRGRRRGLPADEQEPRANRPALLGRIDRRLGVQRQRHQVRRTRFRPGAVRHAVQRRQGRRPVQGQGRSRPARGLLRASRAVHGAGAQGCRRDQVRRLQGQALQHRQSRLRHARLDGRTAQADGLDQGRLLARRRAQGRRAGHRALRQQDRRLLLRRRPSLGRHPGPDHRLRRQAHFAHRPRGRCAGQGASVLRQGDDPRRHVCQQSEPDGNLRRARHRRDLVEGARRSRSTLWSRRCSTISTSSRSCTLPSPISIRRTMVKNGLSAPLHPGAIKYFKEKGWM